MTNIVIKLQIKVMKNWVGGGTWKKMSCIGGYGYDISSKIGVMVINGQRYSAS